MDQSTTRPVSIPAPRRVARPASASWRAAVAGLYARAESTLTTEVLLYALFVVIAAVTRFWDLGSRPLHHDESLHAYFSWKYFKGWGYQHDPMMHGPLLFHMTALAFKIANQFVALGLGTAEYVSRIPAAIFGTLIVGLPWLLRRQLGRVSMIAASFLLLISPMLWYYGRFLRNEAWGVTFTLLIFIGLVRWWDSRQVRWLHLAWISWVFLYTDKAISFIVLFMFVTFGLGVLGLAHSRRSLAWLVALPVGGLVCLAVLPRLLGWADLPAIPYDDPTFQKGVAYARAVLTSPQVLAAIAWTVLWLAVAVVLLRSAHPGDRLRAVRDGRPSDPLSMAIAFTPHKLRNALLMVGAFLAIAVPLYASLFTNTSNGLLSGAFGQLFYWLAQHGVRRGDQPWYYYLVMEPVYEPIAVLLGTAGVLYGLIWLARWARRGRPTLTVFQLAYALLAYWAVFGLFIYSYLGEKMPWLSTHIILPFILLAAVWGARALGFEEGWRGRWTPRRAGTWLFVGLAALVGGWTVLRMASWSLQPSVEGQSPLVYGLLALAVVAVAAAVWLGARPALRSLTLLLLAGLTLYTLQSALGFSYENGAVPLEQGVYVQSSPRVTNVMEALTAISERSAAQGEEGSLIYDNTVSWPYVWYLREFPNARYMAEGPEEVPEGDVRFVLVGVDKEEQIEPYMGNYTAYRYPMRWWFPEEMYRRLVPEEEVDDAGRLQAISLNARYVLQGIAAWREPENQAQLWRYVMYRRPDGVLNSTDMIVYVRNDLVGLYNRERT